MISAVSNNRPQTVQRQNFNGARLGIFYNSITRESSTMTSDYTARAGFNFDPREALAKLQYILKKGVDSLEENLSLMDKPIGKKNATKKVVRYSPESFKSRANRNETMSYSIEFSRGRNDSPEYKKAFGELLEKLKAHQEEQRRIYSPKAPKKGITRS